MEDREIAQEEKIVGYTPKVKVIFVGGCGSNSMAFTMNSLKAETIPDVYLLNANTDINVIANHFGSMAGKSNNFRSWKGRYFLHQLGGERVTNGRGAGGDSKVGKAAAESDFSQNALKAFIGEDRQVMICGALGGGTGGGAMPATAKLCYDLGKTTIIIPVIPDPSEQEEVEVLPQLNELLQYGTVIPVYNGQVLDILKDDEANLTTPEVHERINRHTVVSTLETMIQIIQRTGDIENFDEADWDMTMTPGFLGAVGQSIYSIAEGAGHPSAEQVCEDLKRATVLQKTDVMENYEAFVLYFSGNWGHRTKLEIVQQLSNGREVKKSKGAESGEKNKLCIRAIFLKRDAATHVQREGTPLSANEPIQKAEEQQEELYEIAFRFRGNPVVFRVNQRLAKDFDTWYRPEHADSQELAAVLEELRDLLDGIVPDAPPSNIAFFQKRKETA